MAANIFLKIGDIKGESTESAHKDEIEVLSFAWGTSNPAGPAVSRGAEAGKVEMHPFHFTASTNKASPLLFAACCKGEHFKDVTLSLARKAGGKQQDYLVVKLHDVLISGYQIGGQEGEERPAEEVELAYAKIEVEYQPFNPNGSPGKLVKAGWDLVQNKAV